MVLKMKNKIAIIANGTINDTNFHKNLLEDTDIIICADGGANNAKKMSVIPDYIVGDLDSASRSVIDFFKDKKTKIIKDTNPNKTDLELAIYLAESLNPNEIIILGALGDRIDHTLANIYCLNQIKSNVKARIIDEKNIIQLVDKQVEIRGKKEDLVSVIPISDIFGLNYEGLKWNLRNFDAKAGWFAISNRLSNEKAKIKLKEGKILVIRVKD